MLPAIARPLVEPRLPADLSVTWVATRDEAVAAAVDADIVWVDLPPHGLTEIAGAFLDPTRPETLPRDHPLWDAPSCLLSMHLSGRSQTSMFARAAAFRAGAPMRNVVDLTAGY